jgi:hypothetical protein
MNRVELPLTQLTLPEKLDLMEAIWADLSRNEDQLESPGWHETILKDRNAAFVAGEATISDWEEAKKRIRRNVS